jgi:hypothetical protein
VSGLTDTTSLKCGSVAKVISSRGVEAATVSSVRDGRKPSDRMVT